MAPRTSSISVSFEAWQDMAGDCYQLSLGSAHIVVDRYKKSITVSMYGQKHTLSITPTSKLVYSGPGWCLEVQDNVPRGRTEFKLVEQGCQAEPAPLPTSYIPTTTAVPPTFTRATNMLVDNREFTNSGWSNTGEVWGMRSDAAKEATCKDAKDRCEQAAADFLQQEFSSYGKRRKLLLCLAP